MWLEQPLKSPFSEDPLTVSMLKCPKHLLNLHDSIFIIIFCDRGKKQLWKMSALVICKILVAFVNTLTVDGKYRLGDCENLRLPIQMQLSKKRKTFSQCFIPFLEFPSNFQHFEKKDTHHN